MGVVLPLHLKGISDRQLLQPPNKIRGEQLVRQWLVLARLG